MLEALEMILIFLLAVYVVVLLGKELGVNFKFEGKEKSEFKHSKPLIYRYY